jgi:hypothetical protein
MISNTTNEAVIIYKLRSAKVRPPRTRHALKNRAILLNAKCFRNFLVFNFEERPLGVFFLVKTSSLSQRRLEKRKVCTPSRSEKEKILRKANFLRQKKIPANVPATAWPLH